MTFVFYSILFTFSEKDCNNEKKSFLPSICPPPHLGGVLLLLSWLSFLPLSKRPPLHLGVACYDDTLKIPLFEYHLHFYGDMQQYKLFFHTILPSLSPFIHPLCDNIPNLAYFQFTCIIYTNFISELAQYLVYFHAYSKNFKQYKELVNTLTHYIIGSLLLLKALVIFCERQILKHFCFRYLQLTFLVILFNIHFISY